MGSARRDTSGFPICPRHAYVETRRPGQSCSPRLTPGVRAGSARAMATIAVEAGRDSAPLEPVPWPRGGLRLAARKSFIVSLTRRSVVGIFPSTTPRLVPSVTAWFERERGDVGR